MRSIALAFLFALSCSRLALAAPQMEPLSEPEVRAAYLLNFARFTTWPVEKSAGDTPLVLCAINGAVAAALEQTVMNRLVGTRALVVRRIKPRDRPHDCALLYVGGTALSRDKRPVPGGVLTVGDGEAFARSGGVIGMYIEDDRIRFAVNLSAAERAHLRLDVKLLNLARIIKE